MRKTCWKTFFHVSFMFLCMLLGATIQCLDLSLPGHFTGLCIQQAIERWGNIFLRDKVCLLSASYRMLGFSTLMFLLWKTTLCVCRHLVRPSAWNSGSKQNCYKHDDVSATYYAMSDEVLCLWPRSFMSSASIYKKYQTKLIRL